MTITTALDVFIINNNNNADNKTAKSATTVPIFDAIALGGMAIGTFFSNFNRSKRLVLYY